MAQAAASLLCDMNDLRAQNGLRPLRSVPELTQSAQVIADDMAANHFFSHTGSDGRGVLERVDASGYLRGTNGWLVLENLAWGNGPYSSPLATATAWMNSPGHRANLLDNTVTDVGIALAWGAPANMGSDGMFYAVDFGQRSYRASISKVHHRHRHRHHRRRTSVRTGG